MLTVAIVLGGGGTPAVVHEAIVEVVAIAALAAVLFFDTVRPSPDRRLVAPLAALLLLPLLQLIPLPPTLSSALPGRDATAFSLKAAGVSEEWRSLSISPARTLASFLALLVPAAMFVIVRRLGKADQNRMLVWLVALTIASMVLGVMQIGAGRSGALQLYAQTHDAYLLGFQANRNAQADILLAGLAATTALLMFGSLAGMTRWAAVGVGGALLLSVIATGSRMGIALLIAMLLVIAGVLLVRARAVRFRHATLIFAGVLALTVLAGMLLYSASPMVQQSMGRFALETDGRQTLWPQTLVTIRYFWPIGSGVGTFVPAYIGLENLSTVDNSMPNRAHNDYLEIALEAGMAGIALLVWITVTIVGRLFVRSRDRGSDPVTLFCALIVALITVHSLVDYPLRSLSLATVFALSLGFLTPLPETSRFVSHYGRT